MFKGRSRHTLDEKGRLAIPARFKEVLQKKEEDALVLTNSEKCLWAFTRSDWENIETKAARMSPFDPRVARYMRYFISGAQECPIKGGRILIPPDLRENAGLKKDIMLVGELKIFEIWDKERWDIEFQQAKELFSQDSDALVAQDIWS